ncbi:MAG: DUF5017 domain-containing protein [Bacteroidales bacterium]|nr:DUF5017 domain-containing protein [Bacteroides sp.]MCM1198609.1 DUF5017 domain-containing protein [Clostridium sp.]MCM1502510.1 DUF5017 domain-containing protein [Bacteroidales bacterium]
MKNLNILLCAIPVLVAGCTHTDAYKKVDYNVTLHPSNTYYAGDAVKFNITGEVDNILFYSGETGQQYRYRDRFEVPVEDVEAAVLNCEFQARYGNADALEVYVSNSFDGLSGEDGEADRAKVKAMYEGGMQGWTRLDYQEGASTAWTSQAFELNEYVDNFSIAFHWCPKSFDATQRTYWINADLSLALAGTSPSSMNIRDFSLVTLMMNEELDPYFRNAGNGSIRLDNSAADLVLQGVGANALKYALDGWIFTQPTALNKVANDKGSVIKNMQNYMSEYEYVYTEPGTYKAVFVGNNTNYIGSSEEIHEVTVTILEKPDNL